MEAKETAQQPARITTDVKCDKELRPKKQLSTQHVIQQMDYVKYEEQVQAKEKAEHPAPNATDGLC